MLQGRGEVGEGDGPKGSAVVCFRGLPRDREGVVCLRLAHASPLLKDRGGPLPASGSG